MSQQASLQSFFTQSSQQGTAPSQIRNTQVPNQTPSGTQEQEFSSIFAKESDYNDPYQPSVDYLYPSIVPQDTHTQTDLNYITWAIRHATSRICPPSDRIEILEEQTTTLRRTVDTLKHQIEAQTNMITNMHSAIHALLNKQPQPQQPQQQQQQQQQQQKRTAPPAVPQTIPQAAPQAAPQAPPPAPPQQVPPRGWKAGTWATVASAPGPALGNFQVVERRKKPAKPKADPLFKPEYTKINREIIVETTAPSDVNPSEIRTLVNARIQDESCHFISARRTPKDNFILETKFITPATKAMEYAKEIEEALLTLQVPVAIIRANSKWSKFLIHGIPTTMGEGVEAGQLVPRWISRAETRMEKTHSSMVIALPGQVTMETLGVKFLSLFNRSCHIEAFLPTFPDTQCAKCLEYGHRQEKCKNNGRCGHCAGDHLTSFHPCNQCQGGYRCTHTPIRCLNCKGIHKASDPACPERVKRRFLNKGKENAPPAQDPPAAPVQEPRTTALAHQLNCARSELITKAAVEEAETDSSIYFLLLQEPWTSAEGYPPESNLFYIFTASNTNTKCATYVRKHANLKPKHHYTHDNFIVSITVEIQNKKTQILNIYSPGRSGPFAQIAKTIQTLDNCLVMGDFNCHHQMWYGVTSHEYRNNIRADRANGVFTHFPRDRGKRPTIIDLTFVKGPALDHNLRWSTEPYGAGSDHGRTSVHLHLEKPPFVPRR
ncbi:uncharacterized protein H6S33_008156, partial [Morchella sextelata]|uniref:uncharacterized protein n=1 Tax=Morchella sextelata TaxID=1174677 RepID=UPI001D04B925